jgi:hypothetical protein
VTGLAPRKGTGWPAAVSGDARKPECPMESLTYRRLIPYRILGGRG